MISSNKNNFPFLLLLFLFVIFFLDSSFFKSSSAQSTCKKIQFILFIFFFLLFLSLSSSNNNNNSKIWAPSLEKTLIVLLVLPLEIRIFGIPSLTFKSIQMELKLFSPITGQIKSEKSIFLLVCFHHNKTYFHSITNSNYSNNNEINIKI